MEWRNPLPPLVNGAIDWLQQNIQPDMKVFEYGSGTSTLFFSKFVKTLISVEHEKKLYERVLDQLNHFKKMTIAQAFFRYEYIPPEEYFFSFPYSHESFGTTDKKYLYHNFKNYVFYIKNFTSFDLVLINGRARASCIKTALPKIRKGGYLILNNSLKFEYIDAINTFLNNYPRINFTNDNDQTAIWTIN